MKQGRKNPGVLHMNLPYLEGLFSSPDINQGQDVGTSVVPPMVAENAALVLMWNSILSPLLPTISDTSLPFPVCPISIFGDELFTVIYYISHSNLNYTSSHPLSCKDTISFSIFSQMKISALGRIKSPSSGNNTSLHLHAENTIHFLLWYPQTPFPRQNRDRSPRSFPFTPLGSPAIHPSHCICVEWE